MSLQEGTKYWIECIRQWFPDLLNRTYFVPPVHFNRVAYDVTSIAGQDVLLVKQPIGGAGTSQSQSRQTATKGRKIKRSGQATSHQAEKRTMLQTLSQQISEVSTLQQALQVSNVQQTSEVSNVQQALQVSNVQQALQVSNVKQTYSQWSSTDISMFPPCPVQDSDVRDDHAMTHLLSRLQEMTKSQNEVMMVISEFKFSNYLNKLATDIASQLSRPSVPGDFDLLIIHREYGLLVGEMKSVGANRQQLGMSMKEFERSLGSKIVQAARQVKKAAEVIQHLICDLEPSMTCHKFLILLNVTADELHRLFPVDSPLQKDVRQCLHCSDTTEFTNLCLCADHLSSVSALSGWWQGWKTRNGVHPLMSDSLYQQFIARFVGPASTVEVHCVIPPRVEIRTLGEGVAETGERMTRLVLTPEQTDLLNRRPPRVYITGPPGTGKTVVLVLMGLEWLREGHEVHVISLDTANLAATYLIEHQLKRSLCQTVTSKAGTVHRHQFVLLSDDDPLDKIVKTLSDLTDNGHLYLIMDEIPKYNVFLEKFQSLCKELLCRVPHLHLWAASVFHDSRPGDLQEEKLTIALRCPPVVVQQLRQAEYIHEKNVYDFSDIELPAPTHGPPIIRLMHRRNTDGHTKHLHDCVQCGTNVAAVLKELNVGQGPSSLASTEHNSTSPLMYRDVFVLFNDLYFIPCDFGFVQGLARAGIPVQALNVEVDDREVALAVYDRVTVAHWSDVQGLERKVVVGVNEIQKPDLIDSLFSWSRCTSQLIWVEEHISVEADTNHNSDTNDDKSDSNSNTNHMDNKDDVVQEQKLPIKPQNKL